MAVAGLWDNWRSPEGEWVRSFTVVTTAANRLLMELHDRMPVVLDPAAWPLWLGVVPADPEQLQDLLVPYRDDGLVIWPVSRRVGNVKNNDPSLVEPLAG